MISIKPICNHVIVLNTENNENCIYSCEKLHKKIAATKAALFDSNMHQIVCRLRLFELTTLHQAP